MGVGMGVSLVAVPSFEDTGASLSEHSTRTSAHVGLEPHSPWLGRGRCQEAQAGTGGAGAQIHPLSREFQGRMSV